MAVVAAGLTAPIAPTAPASAGCGSKLSFNNYDRVNHWAMYCDKVGVRHQYVPVGAPSHWLYWTPWAESTRMAESGPKAKYVKFQSWSKG